MFQQIFRAQSDTLLAWPVVALVLFIAAFAVQVAVIIFTQKRRHDVMASLALDAETPLHDSSEGLHHD